MVNANDQRQWPTPMTKANDQFHWLLVNPNDLRQ
jgi:hypothetical protein